MKKRSDRTNQKQKIYLNFSNEYLQLTNGTKFLKLKKNTKI